MGRRINFYFTRRLYLQLISVRSPRVPLSVQPAICGAPTRVNAIDISERWFRLCILKVTRK